MSSPDTPLRRRHHSTARGTRYRPRWPGPRLRARRRVPCRPSPAECQRAASSRLRAGPRRRGARMPSRLLGRARTRRPGCAVPPRPRRGTAHRGLVVVRRKQVIPGQHRCGHPTACSPGSSRQLIPREDAPGRAGASGFLLKDTQPAELLQVLRIVMRGDSLLSPAVTCRLISEFATLPPRPACRRSPTGEREVVAMIAHG